MHGLLLGTALLSAIVLRCLLRPNPTQTWNQRWIMAVFAFLLPPLLLLTSAIALVWMGPHGMGVTTWEGWGTYGWALGFLGSGLGLLVKLSWEASRSIDRLNEYALQDLGPNLDSPAQPTSARLLPIAMPFIAQVGLWNPQMVVSQGLLNQLGPQHLRAVLAHEQAHVHYHDTFWFFCFGWLRRLTAGLPRTEVLWQELLILRELRADRVATQTADPLLLAEAFVILVRSPMQQYDWSATLNPDLLRDRFQERIEAILDAEPLLPIPGWQVAAIVMAGLLPLLMVPFHHA